MQYPVSLALEDFVPVLFGGLGFYLIARLWTGGHAQTRTLGLLGAALVFRG